MTKMMIGLGGVMLAAGISGHAVADPTLAQKSSMKLWQSQVDDKVAYVNKTCGTKVTAKVDWDAFFKVDLDHASQSGHGVSVGQYCGEAIQAVGLLCGDKDGKDAVTKKITSFACSYGGPGKRAIHVTGGVYTFTVDFQKGSNAVDIRTELAKQI